MKTDGELSTIVVYQDDICQEHLPRQTQLIVCPFPSIHEQMNYQMNYHFLPKFIPDKL